MKQAKSKCVLYLCMAICSAILLVAGIPTLIIGAGRNTAMLVAGIVMIAVNFYACPILFIVYGSAKSVYNTVRVIEDRVYTVKDIAMHTGKNEETVKNDVLKAINFGYLEGYLFDGEKLTFNSNRKLGAETKVAKCENCGATYEYLSTESGNCPYCGSPVRTDKK